MKNGILAHCAVLRYFKAAGQRKKARAKSTLFPTPFEHSRTFPRLKNTGIRTVDIVVHDEII